MHDERIATRQTRMSSFQVEGSRVWAKEHVNNERFFESVQDEIEWTQATANMRLRNRLVWFCITSFAVEVLLIVLHSASVIVLPEAVLIAISVLMGGSGIFGLGGLLYYIGRGLFWNR
jgi:nitrate reductase gamma subunit